MNKKSIKTIAFIVLLIHGIGHLQGVAASFNVKINNSQPSVSWLLKSLGESLNKGIGFTLFLCTAIIGILTALSFYDVVINHTLWQTLAKVTVVLSTVCLIVFPNNFAMFFNKIGAIAVNLIIYYSIFLNNHWPSELFDE